MYKASQEETEIKTVKVEIEKVTGMAAITMAGVMSTLGFSVESKRVQAGGLPDVAKLEGWLSA